MKYDQDHSMDENGFIVDLDWDPIAGGNDLCPRYEAGNSAWQTSNTEHRVPRSCSWTDLGFSCRSAFRIYSPAWSAQTYTGFRVVMEVKTRGAGAPKRPTHSAASGKSQEANTLQHNWRMKRGKDGIYYFSNHPAPPPFSSSGEPEATLAAESISISGKPPSLSEVVDSEIKGIRKELRIAEYLEEDGHKPQNNIASWIEEIDGQPVAFIKYRTVGVNGGPRVVPRTTQHARLIKNCALHFVHLTVLFAKHQEEVRGDQIRLIKGIIRR
jgi:hypothetical protein